MKIKNSLSVFKSLSILFAIIFSVYQADAQSALFNTPTTDVMPEGETYVEADFDAHFSGYESGGFQSYGGAVIYGARKNVEIGVNAYFVKSGEGSLPVELQPNAKWQFYENEGNGISAAGGFILYLPLSRRNVRDSVGSFYGTVSKKFSGAYGPRFTGGAYKLVGGKNLTGDKSGFLAGYEQPITQRLYFIADWNTGKNRFGYSAAGFGLNLSKRSSLYSAYYFGNQGRANNWMGIYYGYNF